MGGWMNVESFVIVLFNKNVQVRCRSCLQGLNSGFQPGESDGLQLPVDVVHVCTPHPHTILLFSLCFIEKEY